MKYKLKYLIERNSATSYIYYLCDFPSIKIYDINNYELINNTYEININYISSMFVHKFIMVTYLQKEYYGLNEEELTKLKESYPNSYKKIVSLSYIKAIKDIIIENIID